MATRIGAIGLGGLAQTQFDNLETKDEVEIVAGADIDPETRESVGGTYGVATYHDYEEMLDTETLDAVLIVTPHTLHYEQTVACLERDLHVHLEKPMVTQVEQAVEIIEMAEKRDRLLQIGYQRHFHPAYREMREMIESGDIGEVHMASCHLAQDWISDQVGTWRTNPSLSGGGQLSDSGSHLLDVLLWTTDSEPSKVTAVMDDWNQEVDVNSAIAATLAGPDGPITASIGISGDGTDFEEQLVVWGSEGHIEFADGAVTLHKPERTTRVTVPEEVDIRDRKITAFIDAVRGERSVPVPGEVGLRVTALQEAAYRAKSTNETVAVQTLLDEARSTTGT